MKDYTEDYQFALELVQEEGTLAVMTWKSAVTTNQNTGAQTGGATQVADVAIVVLPASARGDSYENQVQVRNTRRSFIAVPKDINQTIKNGYFITVGSIKYEVEASAGLGPSGGVNVLYQGMLRIAG